MLDKKHHHIVSTYFSILRIWSLRLFDHSVAGIPGKRQKDSARFSGAIKAVRDNGTSCRNLCFFKLSREPLPCEVSVGQDITLLTFKCSSALVHMSKCNVGVCLFHLSVCS